MEFNLKSLVRPNIWGLEPYKCARSEFSGQASVWLDANESAFNEPYNRYPDPLQREVKQRLSAIKGVEADRIFLGVGSDECIDMVYRVFCRPGVDRVVAIAPSYGMYEVCAAPCRVQRCCGCVRPTTPRATPFLWTKWWPCAATLRA